MLNCALIAQTSRFMLLAHLLWPRGPHVCASGRGMQAGRWRCAIAGPCAGKPCAAFGWVVQQKSPQDVSGAPHIPFLWGPVTACVLLASW